MMHLERIWRNRCLFRTSKGRIGFTSRRVRKGDLVCVLYGGPSVYILRKDSKRDVYQFVEEAYTHGLMQGEVFALLDEGIVQEQMFVILWYA